MDQGLVAPDTLHGVSTRPPTHDRGSDRPEGDPHDRPEGDPGHQYDHPAEGRDLIDITAVEVISRAAVMLMSAAAEQLGLSAEDATDPDHRDLDEARTLITALAGLLNAAIADLGPHAAAFRDGLQALQRAFREFSIVPDAPGTGPGERPGRNLGSR